MDRPSKAMLARMPLAEAVLLLWQWVTSEERMQGLWERHRDVAIRESFPFG